MREDLDKKLVQRYPLLYSDRDGNMRDTAMCWGFPGNGWYKLLNTLSYKLEGMIKKIIEENKDNPEARCICGQKRWLHEGGEGKCTKVFKRAFQLKAGLYWGMPVKEKWTRRWIWKRFCRWINKQLTRLHKYGLHYKEPSDCERFRLNHPRASQVKEKFGTLRFYLTSGTKEMYDAIRVAEEESDRTCEICGLPGEQRDGGWILTLCDRCDDERQNKRGRAKVL